MYVLLSGAVFILHFTSLYFIILIKIIMRKIVKIQRRKIYEAFFPPQGSMYLPRTRSELFSFPLRCCWPINENFPVGCFSAKVLKLFKSTLRKVANSPLLMRFQQSAWIDWWKDEDDFMPQLSIFPESSRNSLSFLNIDTQK